MPHAVVLKIPGSKVRVGDGLRGCGGVAPYYAWCWYMIPLAVVTGPGKRISTRGFECRREEGRTNCPSYMQLSAISAFLTVSSGNNNCNMAEFRYVTVMVISGTALRGARCIFHWSAMVSAAAGRGKLGALVGGCPGDRACETVYPRGGLPWRLGIRWARLSSKTGWVSFPAETALAWCVMNG